MNPIWIVLIGVAVVVAGILALRLHAVLSLIAGAVVVALLTANPIFTGKPETIGARIATGFGNGAGSLGILIAMAAILGKMLMDSGAAERIVLSLRKALGDGNVALAYLISGFILAALILSDNSFFLLIPLARVSAARSGKNYLLYVLAIVAGAVMTHSLVPPAAGPAQVAGELHVPIATMMLGGVIVGAFASGSGFLYALWANRRWTIPLRNALGVSAGELERDSHQQESLLPSIWLAVLPIAIPVTLIALPAIGTLLEGHFPNLASILQSKPFQTLGEKNLALMIGAAIGISLHFMRKDFQRAKFSAGVGHALASAGVMVLIIGAGSAFGYVVGQTGIAQELRSKMPEAKLALLPLAFLLTCSVRTAQGSAIVSMLTAISVVKPIADTGALGFHPVYLALAIGCGSKPIAWMNDAGFWIIGQTSGMTEAEMLKTVTIMMAIMGVVGLIVTMLGAWIFPMV